MNLSALEAPWCLGSHRTKDHRDWAPWSWAMTLNVTFLSKKQRYFRRKTMAMSTRWGPLLTAMVSNLGDLLSYGQYGIVELPTHSNLCPSRMISVHCCYFPSVLVFGYPFDTFPMSERKSETTFGDNGVGLLLRSAFRFFIGHRKGF